MQIKGVKLVYMGDARYNMGNSLMIACAKMGNAFRGMYYKGIFPERGACGTVPRVRKGVRRFCDVDGGSGERPKGADVLYTDVWVSMGEPEEVWAERIKALSPYQINKKVMDNAGPQAIFMHCLPAFHDLETGVGRQVYEKFGMSELEVTDEVFESEASVVFDEAENRCIRSRLL